LNPKFIVCDEPVSALDVSIQSQILNLLADLRADYNLSYLFIAHNLAVIEHFSDDVAVMYLGKIVEVASAEDIYRQPRHPYTQALLSSAPEPDPSRRKERIVLRGEVPSPLNPPSGCYFHPRCPFVTEECRRMEPVLETKSGVSPDHLVACHHADKVLSFADANREAREPQSGA
jgi:oligopeptide/dipeptide ABC transporter ATP-binding protein